MMCKMSNTSFFTAPIHTWNLSDRLMRPYFLLQASTMCLLYWARNTTSFVSSFMKEVEEYLVPGKPAR